MGFRAEDFDFSSRDVLEEELACIVDDAFGKCDLTAPRDDRR